MWGAARGCGRNLIRPGNTVRPEGGAASANPPILRDGSGLAAATGPPIPPVRSIS